MYCDYIIQPKGVTSSIEFAEYITLNIDKSTPWHFVNNLNTLSMIHSTLNAPPDSEFIVSIRFGGYMIYHQNAVI